MIPDTFPKDHPANDTGPGARCPTCGRPLPPGFDHRLSAVLDQLAIAHDALHEAKALLEEEALP